MLRAEYTAQAREKRPDGLSRPVQQAAGKSGPGFWRWACPGPSDGGHCVAGCGLARYWGWPGMVRRAQFYSEIGQK
jgi:hypothetical protein